MSRPGRTVLGAALALAALLYLLGAGLGGNLVYFVTPSELLARGPEGYERPVRLSGKVEPGSIRWNAEGGELRFRVRDDAVSLQVRSSEIPPELFRDGIDVVLEGSLDADRVFRATTLMVKHSNEYGPSDSTHARQDYLRAPDLDGARP